MKNNGAWGERKGYAALKDILWCEKCGITQALSHHHLVFRGEVPRHPQLHNPRNLIKLCVPCHSWYHQKKDRRIPLIQERKLWELFPHLEQYAEIHNQS